MKVNILSTTNYISHLFFFPLLVNKKRLKDLDVNVGFYSKPESSIFDCDTLLLDSKYFSELWSNREKVLSMLQDFKSRCNTLVWLDSSASTGTTHFQVLPYVDKYIKKQLLKDVSLYKKQYYGARIYTEFYKRRFNLQDEKAFSVEPLDIKYASKISLSWNYGLSNIQTNIKLTNFFRLIPWKIKAKFNYKYKTVPCSPLKKRDRFLSFRGSYSYNNSALSFQRNMLIEKLRLLAIDCSPVDFRRYVKELKESIIAVSPFGAGEICFRDFEIFIFGALLFKPSMQHLSTWPEFFIDNETYVSFQWDFSDFAEKIDFLRDNAAIVKEISLQAQEKYISYFTESAKEVFCKRFKSIVANSDE